ncbi:MAG: hypothetical protein MUC87_20975 [Bacteroidia bacterium]|jgi:hypothetical protein|nr:hypothetical protein [Bacteroidia bacterium]
MLRQLLPILIIAAFLVQLTGKSVITVHYLINKEKISKTLCENKTRPTKKCHGKCQLLKKLREQKQKEEGNSPVSLPQVLKGKTEWPAELNEFTVTVFTTGFSNTVFPAYLPSQSSAQHTDIFHPPC